MSGFIEFLYSRFLLSEGVSIDTRTIKEGNLFFAISGPNFNANEFAAQALEKGASYAVVDDVKYVTDDRIILAENGLQALQDLAIFHRSRYKRPLLALTGSNGKTTTKELLNAVLSQKYVVHCTQGNYNNHIGVPLTLLHIHPQVEIAIMEMGANHVGDIQFLCSIANPTHGLITNIGHAHTETFGGIEGVLRGKTELFDHLRKNEGQVFINSLDLRLSNVEKRFNNPMLYPSPHLKLEKDHPYLGLKLKSHHIDTQLTGKYNYANIAAAVAVGQYFEVPDMDIAKGIKSYVPQNARSQILKKGTNTIIMDAYNANPDSMKAALENLAAFQGTRLAILGDMNELEDEEEQHAMILKCARELGIQHIITTGPKMKLANANKHFENREDLIAYIKKLDLSNATVLLKASRSIKLETVLEKL